MIEYVIKIENGSDPNNYVSQNGVNDNACRYTALRLPSCIARDLVMFWNSECDESDPDYVVERAPDD